MQYVHQISHPRLTIIKMSLPSKLEPKPSLSSTMSLSTRPALKLNHVERTSLPKQVTSARNDSAPDVMATTKDLNQPNHSAQLPPPKQITRPVNDSSDNIPLDTNMIDINGSIFGLLFYTRNFVALSTPKTLMLTKITISRYPMPI